MNYNFLSVFEREPRETGRAKAEAAAARKRGFRGKGIAAAADALVIFRNFSENGFEPYCKDTHKIFALLKF